LCKFPTENAISEKLGLAVENPARVPFLFADEQLALEKNQGHLWNPGVVR
jgi:hypothetical protein